jgi:hypothetical protein
VRLLCKYVVGGGDMRTKEALWLSERNATVCLCVSACLFV